MTTITQFLDKINIGVWGGTEDATRSAALKVSFRQVSEAFWGVAAFVLFLLLGPFSAVAAIFSVLSLAKQGNGTEPEALC